MVKTSEILTEKGYFEANKVLLWGKIKAKDKYITEYGVGNKNPRSLTKIKVVKEDKVKKSTKCREYEPGEEYTIDDIDFLEKEYKRISDRLDNEKLDDELYEELLDTQDKLYELLEDLGQIKEFSKGKGVMRWVDKDDDISDDEEVEPLVKYIKGKAIVKGSPEALAAGKRLADARKAKKGIIEPPVEVVKQASKARAVKGSEEAKEMGRKLAEARKAKKALQPEVKKEVKAPKVDKKKPWFYIGDIPKGYREATEDEAITTHNVSEYGKYEVDKIKYEYYEKYNVLLSDKMPDNILAISIMGVKKKIQKAFLEIEIIGNKIENPKYKANLESNIQRLKDEKLSRKELQGAFNWLYKEYCKRKNIPYVQKTIEKEDRYKNTPSSKVEPIKVVKETIIMNRDPRPIKEEKEEPVVFSNKKELISLSPRYFNDNLKLHPKFAQKLHKKGIRLADKHYHDEDSNIYHLQGEGFVHNKPDLTQDEIIQSVIFNKRLWTIERAKEWLWKNKLHSQTEDTSTGFYRFRQVNPHDIPMDIYHYITHKIPNRGVELVIALRKETPIKGKSLHTINRRIRAGLKKTGRVLKSAALTVATPMIKEAQAIKSVVTNPKFVQGLTTIGTPILSGLAGAAATFATGNPLLGMAAAQGTETLMHKVVPKKYYSNDPIINGVAGVAGMATDMATGGAIKRGRGRPKKGTGIMINNVEQFTPNEILDRAIKHRVQLEEKERRNIKKAKTEKDTIIKKVSKNNKSRIKRDLELIDTLKESFGVRMARLRALKKAKL
jgi:hypothetical protein